MDGTLLCCNTNSINNHKLKSLQVILIICFKCITFQRIIRYFNIKIKKNMKKFTLLLTLFSIVLFASAQNKTNLQIKVQQFQEKFSRFTATKSHLSNRLESRGINKYTFLKSAAAMQKLDSTVVSTNLNTETQTWQREWKDEYIYDSEMRNTVSFEKDWDLISQDWITTNRTEFEYDNGNRVSSMMMYYENDAENPELILQSKLLAYYNNEGMLDSVLNYSTENGTLWILDAKIAYQYNESKQLINMEMWAMEEEVLTKFQNIVYVYTAAGNIESASTFFSMEGEDFLFSKSDYSYDGSGKLISEELSELNFMTFAVEKSSQNVYQYNSSDDVSVETYSAWNGLSWVEEEKYEYMYGSTNFSEVAFPSFNSIFYGMVDQSFESFNKVPVQFNYYEKINGNWVNTEKSILYYSEGTSTGINKLESPVVSVYPNPASEFINVSWNGHIDGLSLEIYQITGAKVIEQTAYSGMPVSISKLENGIYFFKLLNGHQLVHSGKMIKE